jgi:hypothetical protein
MTCTPESARKTIRILSGIKAMGTEWITRQVGKVIGVDGNAGKVVAVEAISGAGSVKSTTPVA